jgi:hypothetical protein
MDFIQISTLVANALSIGISLYTLAKLNVFKRGLDKFEEMLK